MVWPTDLDSTVEGGALAVTELAGLPDDKVLASPARKNTAVNNVNSVMHPILKLLQYLTEPILLNVIPFFHFLGNKGWGNCNRNFYFYPGPNLSVQLHDMSGKC